MSRVVWNGDEDECWTWEGSKDERGYGRCDSRYGSTRAHRASYQLFVGPIPVGLEIDHVRSRGCISRACVNPAHLEPVTHQENVRRGAAGERERARTHCKQGHEFTTENTGLRADGRRYCHACQRERDRRPEAKAQRAERLRRAHLRSTD